MACRPGTVAMAFDATSPEAVTWARSRAAELVTSVTEGTKAAIRQLVTQGFTDGIPPGELASLIRESIGLTERDSGAVLKRRKELLAKGVKPEVVQMRTEAYAAKLRRSRARTIARTETLRASNEGQLQLWKQAVERGHLTGKEKKVWIVADPCPICAPLAGEKVRLDDDFSIGTDPPAHPNCRCTIGLVA